MVVLPGPDASRFGQRQGKLRPALDLADSLSVEPLYVLGNVAALAAATAELSKVPVAPGEHQAWQNRCKRNAACFLQVSFQTMSRRNVCGFHGNGMPMYLLVVWDDDRTYKCDKL